MKSLRSVKLTPAVEEHERSQFEITKEMERLISGFRKMTPHYVEKGQASLTIYFPAVQVARLFRYKATEKVLRPFCKEGKEFVFYRCIKPKLAMSKDDLYRFIQHAGLPDRLAWKFEEFNRWLLGYNARLLMNMSEVLASR